MNNIQFANLLHMDYWFKQPYAAFGFTMWFLVLSFLALVLAGLVLRIWRHYHQEKFTKEIMRRFSNLGFTIGLLGLLWMFFRQEQALFLAWRFWLLLLALIFVWWLTKIVRYAMQRVPELRVAEFSKENKEKYLPGNR